MTAAFARSGMLVGLVAVALPAMAAEPEAVRRFALLVGHNDGGPERPVLRYAHDDADALRDVLVDLGGVDPADATLLSDPSLDDLRSAIAGLSDEVAAIDGRTEVVFYYSGHSDETGLILGEESLEYRELREAVETMEADARIAILDSCASGSLILTKGGTHAKPFLVDESSRVDGIVYITSASEDEAAQEAERLQGSFFTHFLTAGLRGAADTSGDDLVSLHEAYLYAQTQTLAYTERTRYGPQHAKRGNELHGSGDLVLTDLRRVSSTLVLDAPIAGRASVRTPDGRLIAEIEKYGGQEIALALPDGAYRVTLSQDGRFAEAALDLAPGTSALLAGDALAWTTGEVTEARGDAPLPDAPEVAEPELRSIPVRVSFAPMPADAERLDHAVFNIGMSESGELEGFAGGFGLALVRGDARGMMGNMGANVVEGELRGAQTALGYNQTRVLHGVQAAIGANVAHEAAHGVQASVGFNGAVGTGSVAQFAVGANVLSGQFDGAQFAGVGVNVADGLRGAQIGLVNIGGRVHGAQIGLINVGHAVRGTQIGLINVSNELEGTPVGLLSISRNGRYDLGVFTTATDTLNADFKVGGKAGLYTVLGVGGTTTKHWYMSPGMGVHIPVGGPWLDLDVTVPMYQRAGASWTHAPTMLVRSRALVGVPITKWLAPFAGVSFDYRLPTDGADRVRTIPADWVGDPKSDQVIVAWPGFVAGVTF